MQFLKNWQTFTHKSNTRLYIEYYMYNQLLTYLSHTNMELIVLKIIAAKYLHQNLIGETKLTSLIVKLKGNWVKKIIILSNI